MSVAWRVKRAELTSGVGALVLGIGMGAGASRLILRGWIPLLLAGAVLHGWGMYDKHRLERGTDAELVPFASALYWICWGLLAGVVVYLAVR
jgi:hypothetical protein